MSTLLTPILRQFRRPVIVALAGVLALDTAFGQGTLVNSWEGIRGPQNGVPPDPHGAPGPLGVIATALSKGFCVRQITP